MDCCPNTVIFGSCLAVATDGTKIFEWRTNELLVQILSLGTGKSFLNYLAGSEISDIIAVMRCNRSWDMC